MRLLAAPNIHRPRVLRDCPAGRARGTHPLPRENSAHPCIRGRPRPALGSVWVSSGDFLSSRGFAPLSQWRCCIRQVYRVRPRCIIRTGKVHSVAGDPRRVQGNLVRRGPRDQHPARLGNCRGRQWRMENQQECPRRAAGKEGQRERGQALRILSADLEGPSGGWVGLTGLIPLLSKGLSRVFSSMTV